MKGEDSHLEAAYEDANGDPHGIGSLEWKEEESIDEHEEDLLDPNNYRDAYGSHEGY